MRRPVRPKDKVAIVTGAAHGMGEAKSRLFATERAGVVVADGYAEGFSAQPVSNGTFISGSDRLLWNIHVPSTRA